MPRLEKMHAAAGDTGAPNLETATDDPCQCCHPPRKMTLSEREEFRLLNGTIYVNLPNVDPSTLDPSYYFGLPKLHQFSTLNECGLCPEDIPVPKEELVAENHYERLIKQQHERTQQVEARDRWRLLETQTPSHDIGALRRKMALSSTKHQPEVFYEHEGRYQRERAGLYLTSYDPRLLAHAMNREERSGAALTDTSACHLNALDLPTDLNRDMAEIIRYNRSLCGSVAQLHGQPSQFEVFGPFNAAKALQRRHLQPDPSTADIRTQEGGVVWKLTTYGADYNVPKYLQDHPPLPIHARNEPTEVMSRVNQVLAKVPLACPVVCRNGTMIPSVAAVVAPLSGRRDLSAYPASQARVLNATEFRRREKQRRTMSGAKCRPRRQRSPSERCPEGVDVRHYDLSYRRVELPLQTTFTCPDPEEVRAATHLSFEKCFPSRAAKIRHRCHAKKQESKPCGAMNSQISSGPTVLAG